MTTDTYVNCTDILLSGHCTFAIQTNVCNKINGNFTLFSVFLKGVFAFTIIIYYYYHDFLLLNYFFTVPDAPLVDIIPTYYQDTQYLSSLETIIMGKVHYMIH